jgi:hypothetical protein
MLRILSKEPYDSPLTISLPVIPYLKFTHVRFAQQAWKAT